MDENKSPGTGFVSFTFPIPGFVSVVGLAVDRLPGDGVQFAPGLPLCQVHLALFLLGKLLVGNEFFYTDSSLLGFWNQYITTAEKCINDL